MHSREKISEHHQPHCLQLSPPFRWLAYLFPTLAIHGLFYIQTWKQPVFIQPWGCLFSSVAVKKLVVIQPTSRLTSASPPQPGVKSSPRLPLLPDRPLPAPTGPPDPGFSSLMRPAPPPLIHLSSEDKSVPRCSENAFIGEGISPHIGAPVPAAVWGTSAALCLIQTYGDSVSVWKGREEAHGAAQAQRRDALSATFETWKVTRCFTSMNLW